MTLSRVRLSFIGRAPHYLAHKARAIGHHPEITLAGRRLNGAMCGSVVSQLVKALVKRRIYVEGARVLAMRLTFKEHCLNLRNTRSVDIVRELVEYNAAAGVARAMARSDDCRCVSTPRRARLSWKFVSMDRRPTYQPRMASGVAANSVRRKACGSRLPVGSRTRTSGSARGSFRHDAGPPFR